MSVHFLLLFELYQKLLSFLAPILNLQKFITFTSISAEKDCLRKLELKNIYISISLNIH